MSWVRRFAALALALSTGACVSHPVGPARTFGKYEGKAVTTAEGVLSAVQTARLAARTAARENGFGPYLSKLSSESEEAVSSLQGTFDSIQPPNARADALRRKLDKLIGDALDHLTDLRVQFRRGELDSVARTARPLHDDVNHISDFIDAHQK